MDSVAKDGIVTVGPPGGRSPAGWRPAHPGEPARPGPHGELLGLAPLVASPWTGPPEADVHRERMQVLTRRTAFDAGSWGAEEARLVAEMFDLRAGSWDEGRGPEYLEPLADALARGGVPRGGVCVEIGSGTGLQTPTLALHFDQVVSVDISAEMLTRARRGPARLVQADASRLPLASGSAGAIVCVNAFLFPGEYLRVLAPTGRVVYVSTRGERTPIYLAPSEVFAALGQARGCPISAVTSGTGAASWTVAALSRGAREGDPPPAVVPRPGGLTR